MVINTKCRIENNCPVISSEILGRISLENQAENPTMFDLVGRVFTFARFSNFHLITDDN